MNSRLINVLMTFYAFEGEREGEESQKLLLLVCFLVAKVLSMCA